MILVFSLQKLSFLLFFFKPADTLSFYVPSLKKAAKSTTFSRVENDVIPGKFKRFGEKALLLFFFISCKFLLRLLQAIAAKAVIVIRVHVIIES